MEQVQRVTVELSGAPSAELSRDLEAHREQARHRPGYRRLTIGRAVNEAGNTVLSVETRWRDNNTLADYSILAPNVQSIIEAHRDETISGTLHVEQFEVEPEERADVASPAYERLAFAIFVPIGVLVFGLLVIYGLSRIYLSLDPNVATVMAAIVAVAILGVCAFIAANPVMQRWQVAAIAGAAATLLLVGGIFAGVNGKHETEAKTVSGNPTAPGSPAPQVTVVGTALNISTTSGIEYDETQLTAAPGAQVTVVYDNKATVLHNIHFFNGSSATSPSLAATKLGASNVQTVTFTTPSAPGSYFYHCDAHPTQMQGQLIIQ